MIKFAHNNFNVLDLEKSLQFYQEANSIWHLSPMTTKPSMKSIKRWAVSVMKIP